MKEKVELIKSSLDTDLDNIDNINTLNEVKAKYLGKKGMITELTSNMKELSIDERKEIGRISNELRTEVTNKLNSIQKELEEKAINEKLSNEKIEITLPATKLKVGTPNILEKVTEELTQKSNTKEGGNENGKKKTTRGRKKSTTN